MKHQDKYKLLTDVHLGEHNAPADVQHLNQHNTLTDVQNINLIH